MNLFTKRVSLKVLLLSCLFLLSLFVFYRIADEAVLEKETKFDDAVIAFRIAHAGPGLIAAMKHITFFGSPMFLFPAYLLLLLYFIIKKKSHYAIAIGLVGVITTGLMFLLKQVFRRDRPDLQLIDRLTNYSFPSGHAFSSFIFCSVLGYVIWKSNLKKVWKWVLVISLLLFSITIGFSRIVLNVHYATDVIAGFCLGVMWAVISLWLFGKYVKT